MPDITVYTAGHSNIVEEIIVGLKSKDRKRINDALKRIEKLWKLYIDEKCGRVEGRTATESMEKLVDNLPIMCDDRDWQIRYAGMRALKIAGFSDAGNKRIEEIVPLLLERIRDDDGRVRIATVYALYYLNSEFTDDLYVDFYMMLQDMYDEEENPKKRKSIGQALDMLSNPHLDRLMIARGCIPVEYVAA